MSAQIRIQLAAEAEGDLAAIYNHRLKQRGVDGPDGAEAFLDALYSAIEALLWLPPVRQEVSEPLSE